MNGYAVRTRLCERLDLIFRALDHQMDIHCATGSMHLSGYGAADERPNRDRRHEMSIHHVEVDDACARLHDHLDLFAETGEVGGENRRCHPLGPKEISSGLGHGRGIRGAHGANLTGAIAPKPVAGTRGLPLQIGRSIWPPQFLQTVSSVRLILAMV
jgi:hypothetical protein